MEKWTGFTGPIAFFHEKWILALNTMNSSLPINMGFSEGK
jgi:hypothetical protein